MPIMITRRRLEEGDYDAWKTRFEQGAADRKAAGCRGVRRFRGIADPRELMVIFDWASLEDARTFVDAKMASNPKLHELRDEGASPKMENLFMEEILPALES